MALGRNIQRLRELTKQTRPEVARAIGAESQQPIYQLEKRDSSSSDLAPDLAKHFGVDLNVLLTTDISGITEAELKELRKARSLVLPSRGDPGFYEKYEASPAPARKAVSDLLDLSPDDAAKVAALIAAFKNGDSKT